MTTSNLCHVKLQSLHFHLTVLDLLHHTRRVKEWGNGWEQKEHKTIEYKGHMMWPCGWGNFVRVIIILHLLSHSSYLYLTFFITSSYIYYYFFIYLFYLLSKEKEIFLPPKLVNIFERKRKKKKTSINMIKEKRNKYDRWYNLKFMGVK